VFASRLLAVALEPMKGKIPKLGVEAQTSTTNNHE
jgi:hypothetical protein